MNYVADSRRHRRRAQSEPWHGSAYRKGHTDYSAFQIHLPSRGTGFPEVDERAQGRRNDPAEKTLPRGIGEVARIARSRKVWSIAVAVIMMIIAVLIVIGECRLWVDIGGGACNLWTYFVMISGVGVFGLTIYVAERMVENAEQKL